MKRFQSQADFMNKSSIRFSPMLEYCYFRWWKNIKEIDVRKLKGKHGILSEYSSSFGRVLKNEKKAAY